MNCKCKCGCAGAKVGDVVWLASGSPAMTVESLSGTDAVNVSWFASQHSQMQTAIIKTKALTTSRSLIVKND